MEPAYPSERRNSMAREIEITDDDIKAIKKKLDGEKKGMSPEEVDLLGALVAKAESERGKTPTSDAGWYFRWTYRF